MIRGYTDVVMTGSVLSAAGTLGLKSKNFVLGVPFQDYSELGVTFMT